MRHIFLIRVEGASIRNHRARNLLPHIVIRIAQDVQVLSADRQSPREHRQRVFKGGVIIADANASEVGCTVRNQNRGGAELRVAPEDRVPTSFLLYVPVDGIAYRCEMRWRKVDRIGVRFTGTEPKPRRHI